ncbi:MAG TPA: sigma-54-dependent Fis family transcriptional regulator [Candidatus Saccharimonadales bacterium]|nr:sigma-54-dependent Fis family transcriptional regulator [Candidatus Saccharimonadales bacterium]
MLAGVSLAAAGRKSEALEKLRQSCSMADEMGLAIVRAEARAEIVRVLDTGGPSVEAARMASEAAALLNEMARTLPEAEDRHSFMSVKWRQEILQRAAASSSTLSEASTGKTDVSRQEPARVMPTATEGAAQTSPDRPAEPAGGDLRSSVTQLLEEALRAISCDRGLLLLMGPGGASDVVVARGLESESIADAESYCRAVIDRAAQGEEILVVDTSRDERFRERRSVRMFHIVSIICVPLKLGPRAMGALYLDSRAGGRLLREEDLAVARSVADRMTARIRDAWEQERRREEALLRQRNDCQTYRLDAIVGDSPAMKKLFQVLEAVIASDCNVLIMGESGSGKELAARAIHFSGRRKMMPFVPVDCGALQDSLVESEFFGYRHGAFTGAESDRKGLFEEADGGTLFLDEITNTSTYFQSKLLRVLQSGEFRRIGDTSPRKVDVRIVAASNANVEDVISRGGFREDLYYRLNVVTVRVPPLRERLEDVPALAEQMAKAYCKKESTAFRGIGESALRALGSYRWPGNVRELKNAVESALVLSRDGAVRREFLPEPLRGGSFEEIRHLLRDGALEIGTVDRPVLPEPGTGEPPRRTSAQGENAAMERSAPSATSSPDAEASGISGWVTEDERSRLDQEDARERIVDALQRAGGDKSLAARILGCSRMTLYRRMRRLGIDYGTGRPEESPPA